MREGGTGGANTRTGANYEKVREDLTQFLQYSIKYIQPKDDRSHIYLRQGKEKKDNNIIANVYYKNEFYTKFLEPKQVNVNKILSKKLIPDVVVEVINTKFLGIIEIKNQNTTGTVDEKIQTCDFKQRQFKINEFGFLIFPLSSFNNKSARPIDISNANIYING